MAGYYIASRNGIVTVFDSGEKLKILAQNNFGELITATPAIVDNKTISSELKNLSMHLGNNHSFNLNKGSL